MPTGLWEWGTEQNPRRLTAKLQALASCKGNGLLVCSISLCTSTNHYHGHKLCSIMAQEKMGGRIKSFAERLSFLSVTWTEREEISRLDCGTKHPVHL